LGVHAYAITQTAAWGVLLHGKKKGLGLSAVSTFQILGILDPIKSGKTGQKEKKRKIKTTPNREWSHKERAVSSHSEINAASFCLEARQPRAKAD
jgi:hypothetical protein